MYAARRRGVLPKRIDDRLLTIKDSRPKSYTEPELRALHEADHRSRTSGSPRHGTRSACSTTACSSSGTDIQALFDQLGVEDPGHAFYLGRELMKARLAASARQDAYVQEQPLRWGYLTAEREDTPHRRVRIEGRRRSPAAPTPAPSGEPAEDGRPPRRRCRNRPGSSRGSRRKPSSTTGGSRSGCRS